MSTFGCGIFGFLSLVNACQGIHFELCRKKTNILLRSTSSSSSSSKWMPFIRNMQDDSRPVRSCRCRIAATTAEQRGDGGSIEIQHRSRLGELNILAERQRTEPAEIPDVIMHSFDTLSGGLESLQHIPEVTDLGTFLSQLILIQYSLNSSLEKVIIAEWQVHDRFQ